MLNGRLPPRELGLRCQDKGEALAGGVFVAPGFVSESKGASFSLLGDDEKAIASVSCSGSGDGLRALSGLVAGDSSFNASEIWILRRLERGDGVWTGDDF